HTVVRLTRSPKQPRDRRWDPASGEIDATALDGVDAVVHLAGESIGSHRWSAEQKRRILDSRVRSTGLLRRAIEDRTDRPAVFVSASAIGYYGDRGDEELDESAPPGDGFLSQVCVAWENEARTDATRSVMVRTGLVMTPKGGAMQRMLLPAKLGLSGPIGNGRQWWSWITLSDLVGVYRHLALNSSLEGAVNAAAPNPVRQKEFARELGRVLHRPAFVPLPRLAIKAVLGEMGDALLFDSDRLSSDRIRDDGFAFRHPELAPALHHLLD
ncbi:MAG: TIGR01777 family oxidoreductase, partial [Actinomycetota bacterium]